MEARHTSRRSLLIGAGGFALAAGLGTEATADGRWHPAPPQDHPFRLPDRVPLPNGFRPEGIASGPGTRAYVGSLADGAVVAGDLRTGRLQPLWPGEPGRAIRGMSFDHRTGLLWIAGQIGTDGWVWAIHAWTGAVVKAVPVPGAAFLNDLVITRSAVWVTDSRLAPDRLTKIELRRNGKPADAAPIFLPLGGAWPAGNGTAVNGNGIRELPDGNLLLNNSAVGGLWQVDPRTGDTRAVPVHGGPGITAGDGLLIEGRTIYVVRGSGPAEVSVLTLDRDHGAWAARWRGARTAASLDVPSTATLAGGALWAVNARFGVPDPGTAEYWITRLPR
ncbi:superoxide dismutase [Microlunatus sp. GCM10028923]|uniref:superoxide dismutase n=1 Tax=Microlunatus sp. GCM10028923 TaxID=3273400 RepID=UPI00361212E9